MATVITSGILGPVVNSLAMGTSAGPGSGAPVTLFPVRTAPDSPLDLTVLLSAPTGTILQFANTGREILLVAPSASGDTVTVDVGALVLGQPVNNFPAVTMTAGHLYAFGPFHRQADQDGTSTMQVTLSAISGIQAAVIQTAGVY